MTISTGTLELIAFAAALLALAYSGAQTYFVLREDEGDETMKSIAAAIREGANAFLRREYTAVFAVAVVVAVLIDVAFTLDNGDGWKLAVGFLAGRGGQCPCGRGRDVRLGPRERPDGGPRPGRETCPRR